MYTDRIGFWSVRIKTIGYPRIRTVVVTYLSFPTYGGSSYFQLFYLLIHCSYLNVSREANLLTIKTTYLKR